MLPEEPINNIEDKVAVADEVQQAYDELAILFQENLKTPAHVIVAFDKSYQKGAYELYKWQAEVHSEILSKTYTAENPLELALLAVNGSGKDRIIIAPFEVWFLMTKKQGTIVTTSSSFQQLQNQTEKYVRVLCQQINSQYGIEVFDIKQRHIKCNVTGSELYMFATDEAGKAEGYHPIDANAPFAIICNEAKSIRPEIFEALTRCTGFQYWIEVSSPGKPDGHFYQMCSSNRTITTNGNTEPAVKFIRITSDMCPHLGSNYKQRLIEIYGENHHLYKSMVLAEFSSTEEQVVLDYSKYNRAIQYQSDWFRDYDGNSAGLDLSGGGDEQSLSVRNGNKIVAIEAFKITDANVLVNHIIKLFEKYNLRGRPINADAGNMGKTIIDLLHARGWKNVKYIWNQSNPKDELAYANLGTEMWFNLAMLYENNELCFNEPVIRDEILKKQLCSRYYKYNLKNQAQLESKPQAKAKGHHSPDRADSLALAFLNYKTPNQLKDKAKKLQDRLKQTDEQYKVAGLTVTLPTCRAFVGGANRTTNTFPTELQSGTLNASYFVGSKVSSDKHTRNELLLEIKQAMQQAFSEESINN